MHEWMVDNGFTPHIVVDARHERVQVPKEHVKDGKIVLNVSHSATRALTLGNDTVSFETRFGGVPRVLEIPVDAVVGIYARETGQGMLFSDEDGAVPPSTPTPEGGAPQPAPGGGDKPRPKLKVIK